MVRLTSDKPRLRLRRVTGARNFSRTICWFERTQQVSEALGSRRSWF